MERPKSIWTNQKLTKLMQDSCCPWPDETNGTPSSQRRKWKNDDNEDEERYTVNLPENSFTVLVWPENPPSPSAKTRPSSSPLLSSPSLYWLFSQALSLSPAWRPSEKTSSSARAAPPSSKVPPQRNTLYHSLSCSSSQTNTLLLLTMTSLPCNQ